MLHSIFSLPSLYDIKSIFFKKVHCKYNTSGTFGSDKNWFYFNIRDGIVRKIQNEIFISNDI